MIMTYTLTYRRRLSPFKKSVKNVYAHSYIPATDKLWVSTEQGCHEIRNWSNCEIFLGQDWQHFVDTVEKAQFDKQNKINLAP